MNLKRSLFIKTLISRKYKRSEPLMGPIDRLGVFNYEVFLVFGRYFNEFIGKCNRFPSCSQCSIGQNPNKTCCCIKEIGLVIVANDNLIFRQFLNCKRYVAGKNKHSNDKKDKHPFMITGTFP